MEYSATRLKDCFLLKPTVFEDNRGHFFESFSQRDFEENTGQNGLFVQDNQSFSRYGVIRGLHMQTDGHPQAKLIRVLQGRILDVIIDFRKNSETYLSSITEELSEHNKKQLYAPRGFLHGFSVLSETAVVAYKTDAYFERNSEFGLRFDDPTFNIDWQIPADQQIVSEKDRQLRWLGKQG
jgi:dTDP-4-dehydrorhamnose 3,5-epimerase